MTFLSAPTPARADVAAYAAWGAHRDQARAWVAQVLAEQGHAN
jgi:hypothetical protein